MSWVTFFQMPFPLSFPLVTTITSFHPKHLSTHHQLGHSSAKTTDFCTCDNCCRLLGYTYLYYIFTLHTWVKEYKSIHPLRGHPTYPTCTSTWSAAGGAGSAEIPQKLKNILQNSGIDQSFPVHHQWCSQENSWNESSKIFLEELIKNSKNNLEYWERKSF